MAKIPVYMASNEHPPLWLLTEFETDTYNADAARRRMESLNSWNHVLFVVCDGKFIPQNREDMYRKIEDYKFLIRAFEGIETN